MKDKKIRKIRAFQGFDLWLEEWQGGPDGAPPLTIEVYRTPDGLMIDSRWKGRRPWIVRAIAQHGIAATKRKSTHAVCSIGFSRKEKKWYGWSHRAMVGFGVGDRIFETRFGNDDTLFTKHGKKPIRNMADARVAASRFAGSVS